MDGGGPPPTTTTTSIFEVVGGQTGRPPLPPSTNSNSRVPPQISCCKCKSRCKCNLGIGNPPNQLPVGGGVMNGMGVIDGAGVMNGVDTEFPENIWNSPKTPSMTPMPTLGAGGS